MSVYTDIVEIEFALLIISKPHFPIMEQARETRSVSQVLPCFHKRSKNGGRDANSHAFSIYLTCSDKVIPQCQAMPLRVTKLLVHYVHALEKLAKKTLCSKANKG